MSGPTASEQQDGGVESQIAILKERLSAYAPKLAPAPKIGKVDTSKNGACISEDCSSEKNCDICNTKTSSLFYWADFDYCPKTRRVTLKKPLDVCALCLNILDINSLASSLVKTDDDNSLIYSHFLSVNQIDPTNQVYLQQCVSISFAIQVLAREISWTT